MATKPPTFDDLAANWDSKPFIKDATAAAVKVLKGKLQADSVVLDFGCGTGLLVHALADSAALVVGVDSSAGMIKEFQAKLDSQPGSNLQCVCVDLVEGGATALHSASHPAHPLPEQYDVVTSLMTFHHVKRIPEALQALVQLLRPGGRLVVFDLKKEGEHSMRFHTMPLNPNVHHPGGFTPQELCSYLTDAGLVDVIATAVHTFKKPAPDDPSVLLEFELLMGEGRKQ